MSSQNDFMKSMPQEQIAKIHQQNDVGIKILYNLPIPHTPSPYTTGKVTTSTPSSFHDKKCKKRRKKNKNKKTHR